MYVLLSGLPPFNGNSDPETMSKVTIGKYTYDDEEFNYVSESAKQFIDKILQKRPKDRPCANAALSSDFLLEYSDVIFRQHSIVKCRRLSSRVKDNFKRLNAKARW